MSHLITGEKDPDAFALVVECCDNGVIMPNDGDDGGGDDGTIPPMTSTESCVYTKTDCVYVNADDPSDPLCGLALHECQDFPGQAYVFNPSTFSYEAVDVTKVGKNNPNDSTCVYPFECEITGDGETPITPESIIALQAGAVFPGTTLPADDAATVYLHQYSITLGHEGDESADTDSATGCDAVHTNVATGKTINMEPGGTVGATVPAGVDVPAFSNVPIADAVVRVCGELSVKKTKAGEAIAKGKVAQGRETAEG